MGEDFFSHLIGKSASSGKQYRRRKKASTGKSWKPDRSKLPDKYAPESILCRECHRRKFVHKETWVYESRRGSIFRLIICTDCGNVLREDEVVRAS